MLFHGWSNLRVGFYANGKRCEWKERTNSRVSLYTGGVIHNTEAT